MSEEQLASCFTAGFYISDIWSEVRDELEVKRMKMRIKNPETYGQRTKIIIAKIDHVQNLSLPCINNDLKALFDETITLINQGDYKGALSAWEEIGINRFAHRLGKIERAQDQF